MLLMRHRRRFTGCTAHNDRVCLICDLLFNHFAKFIIINRTIRMKRGDNRYSASVAENVSMNQNPDLEKVRDALICARIPKAADQLDGIISKEFCADGIDFSGGERQRIALARIFYENHDILIMDEPTAAMDIRFEKEFYDLVFSYLKDKTILMISHRLASITACDRIFYMENGSITEQGTHQELMEKQGKYAKLFLAQLN